MITRLLAWWRAGRLKRLEYNARCAAAVYQAAKARYEAAVIAERKRNDDE